MTEPNNILCYHCRAPLRAEELGLEHCAACDDFLAQLTLDAALDRAAKVACDWPGCEVCWP